jgi:hypothetical protein
MSIRFVRWDLHTQGRTVPVLRLLAGDTLMTDPGGADCFDSALAAAEAAWRLGGAPPPGGSWLESAQAAFDDAPAGSLGDADTPRVVTSAAMAHERVKWLEDDDGLTPPTGEWMLRGAAGREVAVPLANLLDEDSDAVPLSGLKTAEWGLISRAIEAAGPPRPTTDAPAGAHAPPAASQDPLSGKRTSEWAFAGPAGSADTETDLEQLDDE